MFSSSRLRKSEFRALFGQSPHSSLPTQMTWTKALRLIQPGLGSNSIIDCHRPTTTVSETRGSGVLLKRSFSGWCVTAIQGFVHNTGSWLLFPYVPVTKLSAYRSLSFSSLKLSWLVLSWLLPLLRLALLVLSGRPVAMVALSHDWRCGCV